MNAQAEENLGDTELSTTTATLAGLMRKAREAHGLSIDEVAAQLNLPASVLEAIEKGRLEKLPPAAFVRGYLRSYSRLLNISSDELLAAYAAQGVVETDIGSTSSLTAQFDTKDPLIRWAAYGIVGISLVMLGLWWQTQSGERETSSSPHEPMVQEPAELESPWPGQPGLISEESLAEEDSSMATFPLPSPDQAQGSLQPDISAGLAELLADPEALEKDLPVEVIEDLPTPESPNETPRSNELSLDTPRSSEKTDRLTGQAAALVTQSAPSLAVAASSVPNEREDVLVLSTTTQSWGEVYDANGKRLFFGNLHSASHERLQGRAPFRIILGNSPDVKIEFNGTRIDQAVFNRTNGTARFMLSTDGLRKL